QPETDLLSRLGLSNGNAALRLMPTSYACRHFVASGLGYAVIPDPRVYPLRNQGLAYFDLPCLGDSASVSIYLPKSPRDDCRQIADQLVSFGRKCEERLNQAKRSGSTQ
ncbi:MAG: hypothetical protein AAF368_03770, partial [Planctomycetota bacterium]